MRIFWRALSLGLLAGTAAAQSGALSSACSAVSLGYLGSMNGYNPAGAAWQVDISGMAVDPHSAQILGDFGNTHLHADFSGGEYGFYGIPYDVVDSTQTPPVPFTVSAYPAESDIALAPLPASLHIESSPSTCGSGNGDNHAIVFDKATCALTEFYHMNYCPTSTPQWTADASTIWDTTLPNEQRPYTLTSVDAAGLSVFMGLVRYDEVAAVLASSACMADSTRCYLPHAIRMTSNIIGGDSSSGSQQSLFELPATHGAWTQGSSAGGIGPIEGQRIRLKASYDISSYSATNQVILRTAKKYGFIIADLGGAFYFQGTPDPRWNTDDIALLGNVPASALDVVQQGTIYATNRYPSGTPPTIASFAPAQSTIATGQCTTLNFSVTGASYQYIDLVGLVRSAPTVCPTVTTTYTLTASNYFLVADDGSGDGHRPTASTTVTVLPAIVPFFSGGGTLSQDRQ